LLELLYQRINCLVEREAHAKDANDDHVPAVDSHQDGHLPRLVAVHEAHVEEWGEDKVQARDRSGADQVDDHPKERDGESNCKEEGYHQASEDDSFPSKSQWYVQDPFEHLTGRVHEDGEGGDKVDEEQELHGELGLQKMAGLRLICMYCEGQKKELSS